MNRLIIKGGRVVDPAQNIDGLYNIYVMGGRIASIKKAGEDTSEVGTGVDVVDATGLVVVPGLIDPHVHLREPGFEYKEDITTGAKAAAANGLRMMLPWQTKLTVRARRSTGRQSGSRPNRDRSAAASSTWPSTGRSAAST